MNKNKFNVIKKSLEKYLYQIFLKFDTYNVGLGSEGELKGDLEDVMDCVNLTNTGQIEVSYVNMSDRGFDADAILPYIEKFFKKLKIKELPQDNDEVRVYESTIVQTKMKSNKITAMIREELKKVIKEDSGKRYVATIEFFVWGKDENIAKQEVQQIINMIDEQYDNSPQLTDLTPQSFGTIAGKPIKSEDYDLERDADNPEQMEPDEEDCVVSSNGFKLSVSCGGKFIGEFTEDEDAYKAVRDWKKKNNWTPNTWFVSDHGNVMLVDDHGNEI